MLALLGFTIAAIYWPGMAGAEESSKWVAAYILLPAFLFTIRIKPNRLYVVGIGLLVWAVTSLLWTTVPDDGYLTLIQFCVIACAFVIGHSSEDLRPLYAGFGLGLLISSGLAILQASGYSPVLIMAFGTLPAGVFLNPNLMGETAAIVIVALMVERVWWLGVGILPALILSESRSALLAAMVCGVLFAIRRWPKWTLIGTPLVAGAIYAITDAKWLASPFGGERWEIWRETGNGILAHPLTGWGIGSFYSTFPKFDTALNWWQATSHAHNDLLEFAFELGIPAAIVVVLLVLALAWRAKERDRLVLVAIGITAMFGFPLHTGATAVLFGLVAGHTARAWNCARDSQFHRRHSLHGWHGQGGLSPTGYGGEVVSARSLLPARSG